MTTSQRARTLTRPTGQLDYPRVMSADVEAQIAAYTLRRKASWRARDDQRRAQLKADAPAVVAAMVTEWNNRPTRTTAPRTDWRTALDARITHCPTCDEWIFDGRCPRCGIAKAAA